MSVEKPGWSSEDDSSDSETEQLLAGIIDGSDEWEAKTLEEQFSDTYGDPTLPDSYPKAASLLIERFAPEPAVIYYPGSYIDLSFTKLYPECRTIHVDTDEVVMNLLSSNDYEAYHGDRDTFVPDTPADVVVLFNAGYIENEQLKRVTKLGSVVIANNYHMAATYMHENCPDFELVGAVLDTEDGERRHIAADFSTDELGTMALSEEFSWPPHSNSIFAFQRKPDN